MKTLEANVGAALERLRADMARRDEESARRDEESARQQNAREWRLFGALVGVIGLAVVILGVLIRLS